MLTLRNCHLAIGTIGLAVFLLQGQYMAHVLEVDHLPDGPRMLYRSAHIYLLLAAALNVVAGAARPEAGGGVLQTVCSLLLLIAPPLMLVSFFVESTGAALDRPVGRYTLFGLFGAATLAAVQAWWQRLGSR